MSTAQRAYDILRAFVNQEKEALGHLGAGRANSAEEELDDALNRPWTLARPGTKTGPSALPPADPKGRARAVLGVSDTDDFAAIHKRYENLMKRSSPENFPEGSEARYTSERIRRLVVDAYRVLTEEVDNTERRFGSLEVE